MYDNNNRNERALNAPIVYDNNNRNERALNAPIVPDVESMQAMKAQAKGNVNNNISRQQVINIGSSSPAVVTATMREADREMNDADRWIAMASQGSVY